MINKFFQAYKPVGITASIVLFYFLLFNDAYLRANNSFTCFFVGVAAIYGYDILLKFILNGAYDFLSAKLRKAYLVSTTTITALAWHRMETQPDDYMDYESIGNWANKQSLLACFWGFNY